MTCYLLDSHILVWWRMQRGKLSAEVMAILEDADQAVYYSIISPWELTIKYAKGNLSLPSNFFSTLPTLGFDCIPIEEKHIDTLRQLPRLHGDPFDRMLVAQALCGKMTLITSDKRLAEYPVKTLIIG